MLKKLFVLLIVQISSTIFGQNNDIIGTWKQPRSIHVRNYQFNNNGIFKHDEFGDLSEFHLTGKYTVHNDSIYLVYDTIIEINKTYKKLIPANDTLFIVNENVIQVNKYLYIFNKERNEQNFSITSNTILNFSIKNFGDTLQLQQHLFNKWVTISTYIGSDSIIIKNQVLQLHSGLNKFRIKSNFCYHPIKQFELKSNNEKIKLGSKKIYDKINFSSQTTYQLYNIDGKLILQGNSNFVDCTFLQKGKYILNYDNTFIELKKM